jgi:hypothetical protein
VSDNAKWLLEILDRVKRKLTKERDRAERTVAPRFRALLADVDAARLIAKEVATSTTKTTKEK